MKDLRAILTHRLEAYADLQAAIAKRPGDDHYADRCLAVVFKRTAKNHYAWFQRVCVEVWYDFGEWGDLLGKVETGGMTWPMDGETWLECARWFASMERGINLSPLVVIREDIKELGRVIRVDEPAEESLF